MSHRYLTRTGVCTRREDTTRGDAGASWEADEFLDNTGLVAQVYELAA